MHSSCVHEIPKGSSFGLDFVARDPATGNELARFEPCTYQAYLTRQGNSGDSPSTSTYGWVAFTSQDSTPAFSSWAALNSILVVPPTPSDTSAIIYLFNGVEPQSGFQIMQPVVQWGNSPAGGGQYWAAANWEVFNQMSVYSSLTRVSSGDNVELSITLGSVVSGCSGEWAPPCPPCTINECGTVFNWLRRFH
jgi:hypothetical protein